MSPRLKQFLACLLGFTLILCLAGGASAQSGQAQKSVATISPTSCTSTGTAPNGAITFGVAPAGDPFDCDSDIPWVLSNPVTVTPHGQTGVVQPLNCPVTFSFTVTDVDSAQTQAVVVSATFTGTARATTFPTAVSNVTMSPSTFTLGCREYSFLRTSYTIPQVGSAGSFGVEVSCQCVVPTITGCPPNQEVTCSSAVPDCLTLQDFVNGGFLSGPIPATCTPTLSCSDVVGNQTGANCFTILRTYTLTTTEPVSVCPPSSCTQTITVTDTVPPVISLNGGAVTCGSPLPGVQCRANALAALDAIVATATDNCEGDLTSSLNRNRQESNPGVSCNNTITDTYTVTDSCGNTATCTVSVTANDTTAPVLSGCPPTTASVQCPANIPAAPTVTASDNCDGDLGTITPSVTDTGTCPRTITRTWTATDACGNTASCSQTITVNDTTAPVLSGCPPTTASVQCPANIPAAPTVTASDNCDGDLGTITPSVTDTGTCPRTITRTWTATDACGNTASCSQTITVNDTTAPVLSGCPPTTASVQCPANIPAAPTVTASDNCDGDLGTITPTVTDTGTCPRTITRTWTARDACGNTASCTQTITVNDTTAPVISLTGASCGGSATQACTDTTPHFPAATANDNCDGPLTPTFTDTSSTAADGTITYTRTWNVSDACGNAATPCTFRVIIPKCVGVGRMTGGGSIFQSCGAEVSDAVLTNGRITHGFEIHCDVTHLPNNLEINWKDCTTGKQRKFKLTTLTSATCIDTPAQQYPPDAPFDTFIGTGTGILDNDKKLATISFTFVDAGEPGINDTEAITIKDGNGNVVLSASGFLRKGNQQAHRDN